MTGYPGKLWRDFAILSFSIIIAILLVKTGILKDVLGATRVWGLLGSFVAGIFFTSIFTTVPATVALAEMAQLNPLWQVAVVGAIGSLLGDWIIFSFIKDSITQDFAYLMEQHSWRRWRPVFHPKFLKWKWLATVVGALIIASPLPDELGLAILGVTKTKTVTFIGISLCLNFLGILIIGLITRAVI